MADIENVIVSAPGFPGQVTVSTPAQITSIVVTRPGAPTLVTVSIPPPLDVSVTRPGMPKSVVMNIGPRGQPGETGTGSVTTSSAGELAWYSGTGTAVIGNVNVTYSGGALTVGVAGTTGGSLILSGATSGAVTIAAPAAPTSWTLKLPSGAGTVGQVLSTDGSGNTSWVAGGAITLVSSQTVSIVAEVDFEGLVAGYDYEVIARNLNTTSISNFVLEFGTGSPVTWDTGDNYYWVHVGSQGDNAGPTGNVVLCTSLPSARYDAFMFKTGGMNNGGASGSPIIISGSFTFGLHNIIALYAGAQTDVTAFRVRALSGDMSGIFDLYSIARGS